MTAESYFLSEKQVSTNWSLVWAIPATWTCVALLLCPVLRAAGPSQALLKLELRPNPCVTDLISQTLYTVYFPPVFGEHREAEDA